MVHPALMLRWKDELTVKHIGLLGCASVLTLACFSIETRVYLLTASAPTVCFPFSILNTDKGKWINVDWIQPGELLAHSLWCCMCTCEQVYAVLSGFVLLQGVWAMCLKMMGVCLHMCVTGRAMNQSGLSFTLTLGIKAITSQSEPCDCIYNPKTSPESKGNLKRG